MPKLNVLYKNVNFWLILPLFFLFTYIKMTNNRHFLKNGITQPHPQGLWGREGQPRRGQPPCGRCRHTGVCVCVCVSSLGKMGVNVCVCVRALSKMGVIVCVGVCVCVWVWVCVRLLNKMCVIVCGCVCGCGCGCVWGRSLSQCSL